MALAGIATTYAGALGGYFLSDDFGLVALHGRTAASELPALFVRDNSRGIWGFSEQHLRPIVSLVFWADTRLWGWAAAGFHATNLVAYLASVALLWRVVARSVSPFAATVAALLYGVHPAHVESVAWISGRTDLLGAVAFLCALSVCTESSSTPPPETSACSRWRPFPCRRPSPRSRPREPGWLTSTPRPPRRVRRPRRLKLWQRRRAGNVPRGRVTRYAGYCCSTSMIGTRTHRVPGASEGSRSRSATSQGTQGEPRAGSAGGRGQPQLPDEPGLDCGGAD